MIHKPKQVYRMLMDLVPRIELAHDSLSQIVADLRDANVEVWTGATEPDQTRRSLEGWIQHFTAERARLANLRDAGAGPILQRIYPEVYDAAVAYFGDIPTIVGYMQTAANQHTGTEQLTAGERTQLADAIEALLE